MLWRVLTCQALQNGDSGVTRTPDGCFTVKRSDVYFIHLVIKRKHNLQQADRLTATF